MFFLTCSCSMQLSNGQNGGNPTPTPTPNPTNWSGVQPLPANPFPQQTSQFGVYNNCPYPVWMQTQTDPSTPITEDNQPIKINSAQGYNYSINGQYVDSFRTWPKLGCDSTGNNCSTGQDLQPCPSGGCQPGGIDSLFEATFNFAGENGATTFDGSLVNGFTIPFAIEVSKGSSETNSGCMNVNAKALDYNQCPTNENLSTPAVSMASFGSNAFGPYLSYNGINLTDISLQVKNPTSNTVIGCAAPSTQLSNPTSWGGVGVAASGIYGVSFYNQTIMYSCGFDSAQLISSSPGDAPIPTLPDGQGFSNLSNYCKNTPGYCSTGPLGEGASKICKQGPVVDTTYVKYIHNQTTNAYAYAYDDLNGTIVCSSNQTKITFVLCP